MLVKESTIQPIIADPNESMVNPGMILAVRARVTPFTTRRKSPMVRIVNGSVKRVITGRTKVTITFRINELIKRVRRESI